MSQTVIEVRNLVRTYKLRGKDKEKGKEKVAVNGISFDVKEGEVFGLLGPNGAGKTTTMKVLTTLLTPTGGSVKVLGMDVVKHDKEIRKAINFVFGGEQGVYHKLTAREYLIYFANLYKVQGQERDEKIRYLLELVELEEAADKTIGTFSKGMIQRLHIARSLINDPKIIFLDEPTIGLDPAAANKLRQIIKNLKSKKISIILTTHYMPEADALCDRIAMIAEGKLKLIGTPEEIKEQYRDVNIYEATMRMENDERLIGSTLLKNVQVSRIEGVLKLVRFEAALHVPMQEVERELKTYGDLLYLERKEITLEDVYINLVGARA